MQPYRTQPEAAYRTVEIKRRRPWWIPILLALVSLSCLFLGVAGRAMELRDSADGPLCVNTQCVCGFGGTHCLEPVGVGFRVEPTALAACLIFAAIAAFAVAWLRSAKPVVVVRADAAARKLSIDVRGASHVLSFSAEPALVRREDGFHLHADSQPPIALGTRLSRKGIRRLRALLAHL